MTLCRSRAPKSCVAVCTAVAVAVLACGGTGYAADDDPWLGRDKALHFG